MASADTAFKYIPNDANGINVDKSADKEKVKWRTHCQNFASFHGTNPSSEELKAKIFTTLPRRQGPKLGPTSERQNKSIHPGDQITIFLDKSFKVMTHVH